MTFVKIISKNTGLSESDVRAVIMALREPSKEMLAAGAVAIDNATDSTQDSFQSDIITSGSDYALPGWQAMIDTALAE